MKRLLSIFLIGFSLLGLFYAKKHAEQKLALTQGTLPVTQFVPQTKKIRDFTFGFGQSAAALTWVRLLQLANHEKGEFDSLSWEAVQLDLITSLDRKFKNSYYFGASFLSVFRQDKQGAQFLLEKFAKEFPRLWRAHYLLGYHYYNELNDYEKASKHILKSASLPNAPVWLSSLGVRLLSETGSLMHALNYTLKLYQEIRHWEGMNRLDKRVKSLNYYIQKNAWNTALEKYKAKHSRGPESISQLNQYRLDEMKDYRGLASSMELPDRVIPILREDHGFFYNKESKTIDSKVDEESLGEIGVRRNTLASN